jgi:hypothetical protein
MMDRMIFNTEEIHEARVRLDERRSGMSPAEAQRERDTRVAAGKRRIEELRREKEASKRQVQ